MKRRASSVASSAQCASSTTITVGTESSSRSAVSSPCAPRCSASNAANGAMSWNGASGLGVDSGSHAPHNTRNAVGTVLHERAHEARLPDPGLAPDQREPSRSPRLLEAGAEAREQLLALDQLHAVTLMRSRRTGKVAFPSRRSRAMIFRCIARSSPCCSATSSARRPSASRSTPRRCRASGPLLRADEGGSPRVTADRWRSSSATPSWSCSACRRCTRTMRCAPVGRRRRCGRHSRNSASRDGSA